jgi:alkylated DNA repair dioxygenase AlkB
MNTLFPLELNLPEGFFYYPDFLSEDEEKLAMSEISKLELHHLDYHGYKANRRIRSFGYDYNFENNKLTKGSEIPATFNFLLEKVAKHLSIASSEFAELLVTEYSPGTVINWHRDVPQFDRIAGISLLSDCTFRLRPYEKEKQTRSSIISFPVQRRSLYVMQRAARWDWQHSIAPVNKLRYSITLRTLRK